MQQANQLIVVVEAWSMVGTELGMFPVTISVQISLHYMKALWDVAMTSLIMSFYLTKDTPSVFWEEKNESA